MRKIALFLTLALLACATPSTPFEGRPVLTGIDFVGNHSISASELREHIATAPTSGFFKKTARYYDADLFAIDLKRIVRWYNEKGFYEARITNVEEIPDEAGRVRLVVHIEEGRRAYVKEVNFENTNELSPDELSDIADAIELHPGDPFDEDLYDKSKEQLVEQLRYHGFADAKVSGQVRVAPEDGTASITYTLQTGPRYQFGDVVVSGNRTVDPSEIVRATGIRRGDPFTPRALQLAQQRVYNLGAFTGVRVSLEPLGSSPFAVVRVTVREAPLQTVRVGVGGQIEETRWELPRLHADYTNRNLFGGLRRLELSSNLGYAFVPTIFTPDDTGIVTLTSAQLVVPNVLFPGFDFINRVELARELQRGFRYDEVGARTSLLYRIGRHSVSGSLNFVRYFNGMLNNVDLATLVQRGGQSLGILANQNCLPTCTLTYPELRYTYDSRDNVLEPTTGFFGTLAMQQSIKPGSFRYFRIEPEIRTYFPITPWLIVAGRAQYGALILEGPNQDPQASPFTQRFFGGGQSYQRGYSPLGQGPKAGGAPNARKYYTTYAAIGGNGAALLSGELRFRTDFLLRNLGFVLFADASRITATPSLPWEGRLEVAPGIGLRYLTPLGPVRFDIAYVLNPAPVIMPGAIGTDPNTGQPVVIANPTPVGPDCIEANGDCVYQRRWSFHITLGEAF